MSNIDFLSIGDATTDAFIDLKNAHVWNDGGAQKLCVNFGDKIEYESVDMVHGVGNAPNAAISASRLGLQTALSTNIGSDTNGKEALKIWQSDSVDTTEVRTHSEFATHFHFVLRHGAERTILIKHEKWPYVLPSLPTPPKWIYLTSLGKHSEEYHHRIAEYCTANNVKLAFQPGTFQINFSAEGKLKDIYEATEIFFCNKEEAQRILGEASNNILELLPKMIEYGPNIAVITDGPRGAYASDGKRTYHMPMYPDPAPAVDRTGAGDAFASTVTAMLASGMSLQDALERGPINSMNVVQHIGAQAGLLTRGRLEELLRIAPDSYKLEKLNL